MRTTLRRAGRLAAIALLVAVGAFAVYRATRPERAAPEDGTVAKHTSDDGSGCSVASPIGRPRSGEALWLVQAAVLALVARMRR